MQGCIYIYVCNHDSAVYTVIGSKSFLSLRGLLSVNNHNLPSLPCFPSKRRRRRGLGGTSKDIDSS